MKSIISLKLTTVRMNTVFESGKSVGFFGAVLADIQRFRTNIFAIFVLPSLEWSSFIDVITYFSAGVIVVLVILLVVLGEPTSSI